MLLRNPTVWFGLSVLLILGGVRVVWTTTEKVTAWQPEIPGRRFRAARLYTHGDCPLCTETQELLTNYAHVLPPIETLDVEADPHLRERFGACTPVLELDNRVRFRGGISEILLRRLIEGTPPVVESP